MVSIGDETGLENAVLSLREPRSSGSSESRGSSVEWTDMLVVGVSEPSNENGDDDVWSSSR